MADRRKCAERTEPKTLKACALCKTRKAKCDGCRPQCGLCCRLSVPCDFTVADGRKLRPKKSEVDALKTQVKYLRSQLEESRRMVGSLQQSQAAMPTEFVTLHNFISTQPILANESLRASRHQLPWEEALDIGFEKSFSSSNETTEWHSDLEPRMLPSNLFIPDPIEALSSVMAQLCVNDVGHEPYYLGPTINLHFLAHRPGSYAPSSLGSPSIYNLGSQDYSLAPPVPPSHLVSLFELKVQPYIPISIQPSSNDSYLFQISSQSTFLYDQILAIGAWCLDENDSFYDYREECIDFYSQRAACHLHNEIHHICLRNVQVFLLKAYLATVNGEFQTSTIFLAICCAMAKRLGLHLDRSIHGNFNNVAPNHEVHTERDAAFWACFRFDRELALLEGRACYMPACDTPICRPLYAITSGASSITEIPLSLELINASCIEFLHLQDETLSEIYSFKVSTPRAQTISNGHLKYTSWLHSLPPCMQSIKTGQGYHPMFLSFHMTFYNGLILLHRPDLNKGGFRREIANQQCREAAGNIVTLLKTLTQNFGYSSMANLMVVYSALSAGLIHLVDLQSTDVSVYRRSVRALKSIVAILARIMHHCGYAKVALDDLRRLSVEWSLSPASSPAFWQFRQ